MKKLTVAMLFVLSSAGLGLAQVKAPPDVKADHWAKESIQNLVDRGVVKLDPQGNFNGKKPLNRFNMAMIISRTLQEIDENESKMASDKDVEELKQMLKMVTDEIIAMKTDAAHQTDDHQKIIEQSQALDHKLYMLGERIAKVEGTKSPAKIAGELRFRYEHAALDANGVKGSSTLNQTRFRLAFKADLAPELFAFARLKVTEDVGRRAEKATTIELDQCYLDRSDLFGADWRIGRQFVKQNNGLIYMNYTDGLLVNRPFNERWRLSGMLMAEHLATSVTANKSHGHNANFVSLEYKPTPFHAFSLTSYANNVEIDKYSISGAGAPETKEGWMAFDMQGRLNDKIEYFGTVAAYRNQLDESNTKPKEQHLRGDIDNAAYMFGIDYNWMRKFKLGGIYAMYEDNFRAFSVLADRYYGWSTAYHPLEDSLTILGIQANLPGKAAETIYPVNSAAAGNFNSPLGKAYDNRPKWSNLQDIHGYKDVQITGHYWFDPRLTLRLTGVWMTPTKAKYNYADVSGFVARLNYQYSNKLNFELRGVHADSDYGRKVDDLRTEIMVKF